ncbi:MAG: SDR family oxidoreductase [Azospirillaceae bacterium]
MSDFAAYPSLAGRAVFVTGGAGGIGAALVAAFAAQGARVGFVDIAEEAGRALAERVNGAGPGEALFLPCDLRDIDALRAAIAETAARFGPIRALMNNAADDTRHPVDEVTPDYWDDRMAVNLRHQFFAAQAVRPGMREAGGGSIVNFGSVSWYASQGGMPAYTSAKAAVEGLTRGLARDFGPEGIRVNTLVPGWTMTERQLRLWVNEATKAEIIGEKQCLNVAVEPDDIARMALFLAADDSRMCTAQAFIVDGGWV